MATKTLEEKVTDLSMNDRNRLIWWLVSNRPTVIREAMRYLEKPRTSPWGRDQE